MREDERWVRGTGVFCLLVGFLSLHSFQSTAWAHARWKLGSAVTPPRNDSTGLKTAPCGGVSRTATPRTFRPGQQITVEFEETINHLGYFEIYFLPANDTIAGTPTPLATVQDTQNTQVVNGVNHQFTAQITLPSTPCEQCTIQLIQVMQDQGPAGPRSFYYSCTDVRLSNTPPPTSNTSTATSTSTTPTSTSTSTSTTPTSPVPSSGTADSTSAPLPKPTAPASTGTEDAAPEPQTQPPAGKPEKPAGLKLEKQGSAT